MEEIMRKVNAVIERAKDGTYSIYSDAEDLDYLVTGTGKTVEEAMKCFEDGYEDMKKFYAKKGMPFTEVEMEYKYDLASFLNYYSKIITFAGLSRLTGINQQQLSHYANGYRKPSARTKEKVQNAIYSLATDFGSVRFV